MKEEIWKDVCGFEGLYLVSNFGRVKGLDRVVLRKNQGTLNVRGKLLKVKTLSSGYYKVNLNCNGSAFSKRVHRLVASAFIPNPKNHKTVNHKNGNKLDNRVPNLEWCSLPDNLKHAKSMGLLDKNLKALSKNNRSRRTLSDKKAKKALEMHKQNYTQVEIAKKLGVKTGAIFGLIHGISYKDIEI